MFNFGDLFQWERFITPSIIKIFYWLVVAIVVLGGVSLFFTSLRLILVSPIGGLIGVITSIVSVLVGILAARIGAEFVLIVFRINEHLGAIRNRGGQA